MGEVVRKLLSVPCLLEIIIVDDCSTDGTGALARELARLYPQVRLVRHDRNAGKTAALKTGFALTGGKWLSCRTPISNTIRRIFMA